MNKKYFNIFKNTNGWQKFFIGTGVIVIFALFLAGSIGLIDTMSSSSYGGNIFSRKDECKDSAYYDSSSYSTGGNQLELMTKSQILEQFELAERSILYQENLLKDIKSGKQNWPMSKKDMKEAEKDLKRDRKCLNKLKKEFKKKKYI